MNELMRIVHKSGEMKCYLTSKNYHISNNRAIYFNKKRRNYLLVIMGIVFVYLIGMLEAFNFLI